MLRSFEELDCWKAGREVRLFAMQIVRQLPREETYALISQIKRASRSVTNNIAEGYGRFHYQENIQFCRQARGSLYELIDHFLIAKDEAYITDSECNQAKELVIKACTLLNGYINYLKKAKQSEK